MQNSHRAIDDMIAQGSSILGSLQTQHMSLKGVRRKIIDVGQTVCYKLYCILYLSTCLFTYVYFLAWFIWYNFTND